MKIIAGKYKGRSLFSPKNNLTRPTSSRVRETLFNIIQDRIEDAVFLELFSGSGAVGFEALSRNAQKVFFVENNLQALSCIKKNIEFLKVNDHVQLLSMDVFKGISLLGRQKIQFDIIYADPPYNLMQQSDLISINTLVSIDSMKLLKSGGVCFIEEGQELPIEKLNFKTIQLKRIKKQGNAFLHEFEGF